jgi:hypothetical protein
MSFSLFFWKQDRPIDLPVRDIAWKLHYGELVEGVAILPTQQILARLSKHFPQLKYDEDEPIVEFPHGAFEVYVTDQHVAIHVDGDLGEPLNIIAKVMGEFGCPLYNDYDEKRYDRANGTEVGDPPPFQEISPEQRERFAKAMQEALAQLDEKVLGKCEVVWERGSDE